jgi:hypothetical protein
MNGQELASAGCERMAGMGVISRGIEKLPAWIQLTLMVLAIVTFVYGIAHYGWSFIFRVIFSPDL